MKKMDNDLPFYYWTLNERFHDEEADYNDEIPHDPDVDVRHHPKRLHRLTINRREDASVFAAGRQYLPARHRPTIRQLVHRFDVGLPPVPDHQMPNLPPQNPN